MKIVRLEDAIERSIIYAPYENILVKNLPTGLRKNVTELLKDEQMRGAKTIQVGMGEVGHTIEWADKVTTLGVLPNLFRTKFKKTLELLEWFVSPKWQGSGRGLGGRVYCVDCSHGEIPVRAKQCRNSQCPSQEKWNAVLGCPQKVKKTSSSIRKIGVKRNRIPGIAK